MLSPPKGTVSDEAPSRGKTMCSAERKAALKFEFR